MTSITITKGAVDTPLYLKMLNRHGLIAGATGTGKTVTLKVITEKLSQQGIPVFLIFQVLPKQDNGRQRWRSAISS